MAKNNSRLNKSFMKVPFADETGLASLANEQAAIEKLLASLSTPLPQNEIESFTKTLINYCRENHSAVGLEPLLQEYPLNSTEGMILMSLAEALLRIPDKSTALKLAREQFSLGDWSNHLHHHDSWFVDFSSWGAVFTNQLLRFTKHEENPPLSSVKILTELVSRLGEETIISIVNQAISLLGKQFVIAPTMHRALSKSKKNITQGYRFTYDMLGEAAVTEAESIEYLNKYKQAIESIGIADENISGSASVSIKLSALYPRFEYLQKERVYKRLFDALMSLCLLAKKHDIAITIDAEEIARIEMTLVLLEKLLSHKSLQGWNQLGIAVQAYHKRAPEIINQVIYLAKKYSKLIPVRLVKGAYWDYEIKLAQQQGLADFPVFTNKINTELCYLVCTEMLFANSQYVYPQFATHNCQTIASIYYYAEKFAISHFEFQQLYGMGDIVYEGVNQYLETHKLKKIPCCIYAPVGEQNELLPYLVRRLIENGANNSFINELYNQNLAAAELIIDIHDYFKTCQNYSNPHIARAADLFQDRKNSQGLDLSCSYEINHLTMQMQAYTEKKRRAGPLIYNDYTAEKIIPIVDPTTSQSIGECELASDTDCQTAMVSARKAFNKWKQIPAVKRGSLLYTVADLIQHHSSEFVVLLAKEAGKTLADAINEIREAIDFCRYYASVGTQQFQQPVHLAGYTGEKNTLLLEGRGIILCISPWNFPLSIFTGQISAALMAGNCVVAKPASATSMIAYRVIELFYEAGFARDLIQLLPARADIIEQSILSDPALSGVAFTGSHQTAQHVNRLLAHRHGAIIPLIAETGGINVMLADSSSLSEQLVRDIVLSAFGSAGQRCSALRAVFIQDDVYQHVMQQIRGAMQELIIGDPLDFATDIGPLINQKAVNKVLLHIEHMRNKGLNVISLGQLKQQGKNFVLPTLIELDSIAQLTQEIFGPVLHVIRYQYGEIETIIDQVNQTGFGLTFGLHSRIPSRIEKLADRINAGNIYINRNMIGAVVGVQPFGGHGLSGTGPKAGGPNYLQRFAIEKTITVNTTSIGGDLQLLNQK